jgi:hypothetical protein
MTTPTALPVRSRRGAMHTSPRRGARIAASAQVPHTPEHVYAFLDRLDNHRLLQDRYLRLQQLNANGDGGWISIRTPLGLRRTVHTAVTERKRPSQITGIAQIGRTTTSRVTWTIEPHTHGATVELAATIVRASTPNALQLAFGDGGGSIVGYAAFSIGSLTPCRPRTRAF